MPDEPKKEIGKGTQATGPHRFTMGSWISCAPFERLLHMEILEAVEGRAILTMPFLLEFAQGAGLMHGGAMISLADTAVVMAIKSVLPARTHFATIAMEAKFLHPVKQGILTARGRVVDQQERNVHGQATVYDEEDRAVLEFFSTFRIARDARIRGVTFQGSSES